MQGSGDGLKEKVRSVIDGTLAVLEMRAAPPSAAYLQNSNSPNDPKIQGQRSNSETTYANMPQYGHGLNPATNGQATSSYPQTQMGHHSTSYPAAMQYANSYAETPGTIAYTPNNNSTGFANYPPANDGASHLADFALAATQQHNDQWSRAMSISGAPGHAAWQHFAQIAPKFSDHVEPQDRHSATALMSLNGRSNSMMALQGLPDNVREVTNLEPVSFGQAHMSVNLDADVYPWPPIGDMNMLGNSGGNVL